MDFFFSLSFFKFSWIWLLKGGELNFAFFLFQCWGNCFIVLQTKIIFDHVCSAVKLRTHSKQQEKHSNTRKATYISMKLKYS